MILMPLAGLTLLTFSRSPLCAALPPVRLKSASYDVGLSKIDITPGYPIRLNGYLGRNAESTNAVHPLYAKAIAFGSDRQGPAVLICVDNCIVPQAVYNEVAARLL